MRFGALVGTGCIFVAMAVSAAAATAAVAPAMAPACMAGQPTAASYTWDFKGEAKTIFDDIQSDAQQASDDADMLQSFTRSPDLSWQTSAYELSQLSDAIDDIGAKLCRLDAIRRVVAPQQQRMIDLISAEARLMSYHAQSAYNFVTTHPEESWHAAYRGDVTNLYNEASALTRSVSSGVRASS
jgi:hypothetical protein